MTTWIDVKDDPKYIKVLDKGFCGLIDYMGSDADIAKAARVSYGSGTKSVREDRALIRYLMRHNHTSPFEMLEVKFHIKLPLFVFAQLVRHRTASVNAYSGRYSIMTDEFYIPELENIKPQATLNKQGRTGSLDPTDATQLQHLMSATFESNYAVYRFLLGEQHPIDDNVIDNFQGIARELARTVLPASNYTEVYWKQNFKNLCHLLKLRLDLHAQWEIRQFAQAFYDLVQPLFPIAIEAFEDYDRQAVTISRMEKELLMDIIHHAKNDKFGNGVSFFKDLASKNASKQFAQSRGMTERELTEFMETWNLVES